MTSEGEILNYPFEEAAHQRESAIFGMWIFIATEVLFFGGMFTAYMVYRFSHPEAFIEAGHRQEWYLGFLNTVILIVSGFTMALAVEFAKRGNRRGLLSLFAVTGLLGIGFLAVEGYEYYDKYTQHLFPGRDFHFVGNDPQSSEMGYYLYFLMTGIHGLHMTIGVLLIAGFGIWAWLSPRAMRKPNCFEVLGLYWAFVDIVWMFLYPLFYLIHP
jgi:cytochrome c oxidase subunit 3